MATRYFIECLDGEWMCMGEMEDLPTPTTAKEVLDQVRILLKNYRQGIEWRVTMVGVSNGLNVWADVTSDIEAALDREAADDAREAQEDADHIKSETFGWRDV